MGDYAQPQAQFVGAEPVTTEPRRFHRLLAFLLPQNAAVDDMTLLTGERVVRGKIKRREEARAWLVDTSTPTLEQRKKLGFEIILQASPQRPSHRHARGVDAQEAVYQADGLSSSGQM